MGKYDVDMALWEGVLIGIVKAMPEEERQALADWEKEYVDGSGKFSTSDWPGFGKYNVGPRPGEYSNQKIGFVYLLKAETGEYKIGRSIDVQKRLKALTSQPADCELVHSFPTENMLEAERKLHKRFANCRIKREWFALTPQNIEDIKSIVNYKQGEFVCHEY